MFLHSLQSWFDSHQRALPWRKSKPLAYEVWISEVMSQQSVLETVKMYFIDWMQRFPNLEDLAKASEDEVMTVWAGLGYYSRARLIHKTAQILSSRLDSGQGWPARAEGWMELPGVGPYTAKAISAIAFGEPVLPMDGNLIRVLARFYGIRDPLNSSKDLQDLKLKVAELEEVLRGDATLVPRNVAQAFMDLGATICRPKGSAVCELCPIRDFGCVAKQNQEVEAIPQTKARQTSVYLDYLAIPKINQKGLLWVEPVEESAPGNLVGQWQIPLIPIDTGSEYWQVKSQVRHSITHHRFRVRVKSKMTPDLPMVSTGKGKWVDPQDPRVHLTTLSRKILLSFSS